MGIKAAWKGLIQGAEVEGGRSPLIPSITQALLTQEVIDKNNYKTYSSMVKGSYEMYNNRTDYGAEMYGSIIDTVISFIAGEGLSVIAKKNTTQKYINKFLKLNNLHGSLLLDFVRTGCLEGKDLIVLKKSKKKDGVKDTEYIKAQNIQWWTNPYTIEVKKNATDEIAKVLFKPKKEEASEITLPIDKLVYVKLGGTDDRINETANRLHRIMTDAENFSRAKYDLRKNNHLFAKIMPYFQTETIQEAKALNNAISNGDWQIGQGYAGTASFNLISPALGALEALKGEMLQSLKIISTNTGIPIHWLAYPELMSNRATAENLLEVINAATRRDRLIWEQGLRELIDKSMIMAIDSGLEDNNIIGEYRLELPLISLANLKAIQETWIPMQQLDIISMGTLRSKIPSINPAEEEKMIEKEKQENTQRFQEAGGKSPEDLRNEKSKNINEGEEENENT